MSSKKLKFEAELQHAFGDPEDFGQGGTIYHCRYCGALAASPKGNQDLCKARLYQKLVDIQDVVESNNDHDAITKLFKMFGLGG